MPLRLDLIAFILFCVFCAIQLFYYLFYFLRLAIHKNKPLETVPHQFFSIVICARNEERNIEANIESWMNQNYLDEHKIPMYEVLIVDDNSDDNSAYLYNNLKIKYDHLRVLQLRQEAKGIKGKKFPLSMGIKEAKYENLLLTDADCKPNSENWLALIANSYRPTTEIVLGYSGYKKSKGFLNKWIRWETLHTAIQYLSYSLAGQTYMGVGRNLSYKKNVFNANKGFSTHNQLLSGDDDLFINKVSNAKNTIICVNKQAHTTSKAKETYPTWWHQKSRHMSTSTYYKTRDKVMLGIYSVSHTFYFAAFVWALCYAKYRLLILAIFGFRWLLQFIVVKICAIKLNENKLANMVWLFDIVTIFYNFRMLPHVFFKNQKWK
jgi:glycosyltransferase involved in cell wall biosynthesis